MPTSSFDKEFIITDVKRFIEALEASEEFNRKKKLEKKDEPEIEINYIEDPVVLRQLFQAE